MIYVRKQISKAYITFKIYSNFIKISAIFEGVYFFSKNKMIAYVGHVTQVRIEKIICLILSKRKSFCSLNLKFKLIF